MPETKKVPAIRFNGFSDDWEQRKLGEVGKARSGVGFPDIEQGGTSGTPFFKVSDMNNDGNENEMNVANNYVTDAQITARRWSLIEEVPAIFFAKVGAAVMLNRKRLCRFPFLLDNNTMAYSLGKDQWDADFAKALFETVDLTSLVQVGALPSYNAGDVEAMEIMLPDVSEQHQIGAYFRQLDNLMRHQSDELVDAFDDFSASSFDALAKIHWVVASGDELVSFGDNVVSKNGNGGGTIASDLVELLRGGLDELSAELVAKGFIVLIAEVDSFGDGDAIMGDGGAAVFLVDGDIAAFRAEGGGNSVGDDVNTDLQFLAGIFSEN